MFTSQLYNRSVELKTAADIAQYCSVVQPTISHLDLALINEKFLNRFFDSLAYEYYTYSSHFIYNEEQCRKNFSTSRNMLYTLHLDLPIGREKKLFSSPLPGRLSSYMSSLHIEQLHIHEGFYFIKICEFLNYASPKQKLLKWFINLNVPLHFFQSTCFLNKTITHIVDCMDPELNASNFIKEWLEKINFIQWLWFSLPVPETLRNLLYKVHQIGRKSECVDWIDEFVIVCILHPSSKYVEVTLKFINSPSIDFDFYSIALAMMFSERRYLENSNFQNVLRRRSFRRRTLLLHTYCAYISLTQHTPGELNRIEHFSVVCKGLGLFWNSVPDSFLTFEEIKEVFANAVSPEVIGDLSSFYSKAIGKFHAIAEPRSLQHYCRTTIRRSLYESEQWLPEGIRKTGLPPSLQSYLNLE